jgi:hypothetical protein
MRGEGAVESYRIFSDKSLLSLSALYSIACYNPADAPNLDTPLTALARLPGAGADTRRNAYGGDPQRYAFSANRYTFTLAPTACFSNT